MKTISFLNQGWGHALHGFTFRPIARRWCWQRWGDRRNGVRRYSVVCHTPHNPMPGDEIEYLAAEGLRRAVVTDVHQHLDPKDMYRLEIELRPCAS